MSLPVTNLDDRTFQDIVDEAKRLIPQLCPEWTNHNLSDPGVALIELFAWMTETMLYRLNQVPDVFYTRMLNLLGFEQFPPSAARADITFWNSGGGNETIVIPAGTQVATVGRDRRDPGLHDARRRDRRSATESWPRSPRPVTIGTYTDVWEDLTVGMTGVKCFPSEPMVPGDAFYIGSRTRWPATSIRLNIQATVEGIGVNPGRPPLVWEIWQGEGWVQAMIPDLDGQEIADSTGGLNRDGSSCCCSHRCTNH